MPAAGQVPVTMKTASVPAAPLVSQLTTLLSASLTKLVFDAVQVKRRESVGFPSLSQPSHCPPCIQRFILEPR